MDSDMMAQMKPVIGRLLDADYQLPEPLDSDGVKRLSALIGDSPRNVDMMAVRLVSKAVSGDMKAFDRVLDILAS